MDLYPNTVHKAYIILQRCEESHPNPHVENEGVVRTEPPVGVGIGSLPMTPNKNGEIGVLCVESVLAGIAQHNKNMNNEMNE